MWFQDLTLDSLSAGLLVCDRQGAIIYANPSAASTLATDSSQIAGRHIESVIGPEGARALGLARALAGEAQQARDAVWTPADCAPLTVGFSVSPLRSAGGAVAGAIILFREISEVERLRRNMGRAEALASVGILASGMAHQIRNPLAGIRSSVQGLLRRLSPDAGERDRLQRVLGEIDRINNLVKSLLDFARPKVPTLEVLEVGSLIEDALELVAPAMQSAGIAAERGGSPEGVRLCADRQRLQEALLNVLLNAVQAMPSGGTITVRAGLEPDLGREHPVVTIEVSDTGPGIPPERAERIFQPFYTTRPEGTGLGLAVARQAAEEHGGSLTVRSSPGRGATFLFRLPARGAPWRRAR